MRTLPQNFVIPQDVRGWNETSVREDILAPLSKALGYLKGTENDCITELYLRYPKKSLGRKKRRDPDLVGKADYVFEVGKRLRWVMEAKGADEEITDAEREQAYTYATHPEVRALFYVLSNGRNLEIHQTNVSPSASERFCCLISDLKTKFQIISNILSPEALNRDFLEYKLDTGIPLAPGLRSIAKIISGKMVHRKMSPILPGPNMIGLTSHLADGSIQRMPNGTILGFFKINGAYDQLTEYAKSLGLHEIEMVSTDSALSSDPSNPTRFTSEINWDLSPGESIPDITTNSSVTIQLPLQIKTATIASGHYRSGKFRGTYKINLSYFVPAGNALNCEIEGDFEIAVE